MTIRQHTAQAAIERANDAGMTAAVRRQPYSSNPHGADDPARRLAWSQGHNGMRAKLASDQL